MAFFGSISEFTTFLTGQMFEHQVAAHHALERAAKLIEKEAKGAIGEYQEGWAPLAETTLEGWHGHPGKVELGYSPPDNPLLRTGDLRDSIGHEVDAHEAVVGSTSEVAVWQEMGTSKMPPRSFLASTLIHHKAEVVEILGKGALKGLLKEDV